MFEFYIFVYVCNSTEVSSFMIFRINYKKKIRLYKKYYFYILKNK